MKKFLLLLVSLIGISLLQGFVINVFYEWFVQATFHLPKVSFLVFSGIVMVRQYIVASPDDDLKSGTGTIEDSLIWHFSVSAVVLLLGYILHSLMLVL